MLWYQPRSIWKEMEALHREMDDLIRTFFEGTSQEEIEFPLVNVWADENQILLMAEIPGLNEKDLEVTIRNQVVSIKGERHPPVEEGENGHYLRQERGYGRFTRSIRLPYAVDPSKAEARYEKGILCIQLPRAEHDKPSRIPIQTG